MLMAGDERTTQDHFEPHRVQPASARWECKRVCNRDEHHRPSVQRCVYAAAETGGICPGVDAPLPRLERRDLCEIEHVAHEQPVAGNVDACEAVDREVSERMRSSCRRDGERRSRGENEQEPFHDAYLRATGDQRTEKRGFSARARRNHARETVALPRQRSIMPWWKNLRASRVPSLSASRE